MNAQLAPIEEALTRAGIAYQVRGVRFYDRPEVKAAIAAIRDLATDDDGPCPRDRDPGRVPGRARARAGATARRRRTDPAATRPASERPRSRRSSRSSTRSSGPIPRRIAARSGAELDRRAAHERDGAADGVNLLTYHRAKGLEWDAVFLPMLEDGTLPIRQAFDDDAAIAEERRLLYVGITRARRRLQLSWADRRETRGREARRTRSRFLAGLAPAGARPGGLGSGPGSAGGRLPGPTTRSTPTGRSAMTRSSTRSAPGGPSAPGRRGCRPTSSPPTRRSPRSPPRGRRRLTALERVKGIGPAKLDKYGGDILAILAAAPQPGRAGG